MLGGSRVRAKRNKPGKSVRFCQEEKDELAEQLGTVAMDSDEQMDGPEFDSILPGRHDTQLLNMPNGRPSERARARASTYKYSRATTLVKSEVITKDSF